MRRISEDGSYRRLIHVGDESLEPDLVAVCIFSFIGLLLSFRVLQMSAAMPEIMALL